MILLLAFPQTHYPIESACLPSQGNLAGPKGSNAPKAPFSNAAYLRITRPARKVTGCQGRLPPIEGLLSRKRQLDEAIYHLNSSLPRDRNYQASDLAKIASCIRLSVELHLEASRLMSNLTGFEQQQATEVQKYALNQLGKYVDPVKGVELLKITGKYGAASKAYTQALQHWNQERTPKNFSELVGRFSEVREVFLVLEPLVELKDRVAANGGALQDFARQFDVIDHSKDIANRDNFKTLSDLYKQTPYQFAQSQFEAGDPVGSLMGRLDKIVPESLQRAWLLESVEPNEPLEVASLRGTTILSRVARYIGQNNEPNLKPEEKEALTRLIFMKIVQDDKLPLTNGDSFLTELSQEIKNTGDQSIATMRESRRARGPENSHELKGSEKIPSRKSNK